MRLIIAIIITIICICDGSYAQLRFENLRYGGNISTVLQASDHVFVNDIRYYPFIGADLGISLNYKLNEKFSLEIPVQYEHQRVITTGMTWFPTNSGMDFAATIIYNLGCTGIFSEYQCSDKVRIGVGLVYEYRITSHYRLSKKLYDRIQRFSSDLIDRKYVINEASRNNIGYSFILDFSMQKNKGYFIRFDHTVDLLHYTIVPVKLHHITFAVGVRRKL